MSSSYLRGQDLIDQIQSAPYSRDLIGYHGQPPQVEWPNQARVAVQFVLNYEEYQNTEDKSNYEGILSFPVKL